MSENWKTRVKIENESGTSRWFLPFIRLFWTHLRYDRLAEFGGAEFYDALIMDSKELEVLRMHHRYAPGRETNHLNRLIFCDKLIEGAPHILTLSAIFRSCLLGMAKSVETAEG